MGRRAFTLLELRPLEYAVAGKEFKLWSCGPDGVSGTRDDIHYEKN